MNSVNLSSVNQNQVQQDLNALAAAEQSGNQQAIVAAENQLQNDVKTLSGDQRMTAEASLQSVEYCYNDHLPPAQLHEWERRLENCFSK